jgi:6-methylsalicylate decarboxylase
MSFTIDAHHHILPDFFFRETNDAHNPVGSIAPPHWDADLMLSYMDEVGIDVAITSISTPGVHVGDDARARSLARRCNELSASLMRAHPRRLGGFAALPLPDAMALWRSWPMPSTRSSLTALYCSRTRTGSISAMPALSPCLRSWSAAGPWFVHPTASPDPSAHHLGLPDSLIDFTADTTRAVAQMHYSNRFARTPQREIHLLARRRYGTVPGRALGHRRLDERHPWQ